MAVGLQNGYNPSQTVFAGLIGFGLGGYTGYYDPGLTAFTSGFQSLLRGVASSSAIYKQLPGTVVDPIGERLLYSGVQQGRAQAPYGKGRFSRWSGIKPLR